MLKITPYKNRLIILNKPVKVYRNLNKKGKIYSIQQNGLVVGHTSELTLKDVKFIINKSGKERCIRLRERNVHAFILGYISLTGRFSYLSTLTYYPFSEKGFIDVETGEEIYEAKYVNINKEIKYML